MEIDIKGASQYFNNKPFNLAEYLIFQGKKQEKLFCPICQGNQEFIINNKIFSSPLYFILSLNRGNEDKNLLNIYFKIEEFIDIGQYLENKKSFSRYGLTGIVSYHMNNNSYVCFGKSPVDKQWYLYNDDKVENCSIYEIINYNNGKGYIPCILTYQHIK